MEVPLMLSRFPFQFQSLPELMLFPLVVMLLQTRSSHGSLPFYNGFYYDGPMNDKGDDQGLLNGVRLTVETSDDAVSTQRGANVTLPCHYHYVPKLDVPRKIRIKWSKLREDNSKDRDVLVASGRNHRSFGEFRGRTHLQQESADEASLVINDLRLNDAGKYRCEVIDGLEDESGTVDLELEGVVFPYQPPHGRYKLNFHEAKKICEDQDAVIASFDQLFNSWLDGLDWCNAGWLIDGTVQYPITVPREPCGGHHLQPGIRSYGERHKNLHHFDVFCFSSALKGTVYYLDHTKKFTLEEAKQACQDDKAEIAKVGQLYSAWKFLGLDCCNSGWLADGSVRYPITSPRPNCGPPEPGVRSFGFPQTGKFGVFCYKMS
ncbi:hyaluronan and proteoglycan link protein 3 isoform X1 [Ahaetulla prasina]|uniref:hyaluronan and proteoglycan link protein 3 isoform X1 n=1 Tax=Ahaetulla prasina TaxID=499056 RepID=UPI002649C2B8|nr:hyaluronan and proteoglycan link protein 3 isoform X1 [Ahaetulla prasina]XP_058012005.1 hyaluronan and proteoglycan link protein 3 isoform X1 [Ahaetulla prasina]